jgi:hypothetical protein
MLEVIAFTLFLAAVSAAQERRRSRPLTDKEFDWVSGFRWDNPPEVSPSALDWRFERTYPTLSLLSQMSVEDWKDWYKNEMAPDPYAGWDRDGYYENLLNFARHGDMNQLEPVVVIEDKDGAVEGIWDGWHRSGAAITAGRLTIPAYIGRRRAD